LTSAGWTQERRSSGGAEASGFDILIAVDQNIPDQQSYVQSGAAMLLASACCRFQSASRCFGFIP
jgi:hypothetical protein